MFSNPISSITLGRSLVGAMMVLVAASGSAQSPSRQPSRSERPSVPPPAMARPMPSRDVSSRPMPPSTGRPPARVVSERPGRPTVREAPVPRVTNGIVSPRPMLRCAALPTPTYWRQRDIMAEIQAIARHGRIQVHPVGEETVEFTGVSDYPAGWTAYGFRVPSGENIHVRLTHSNEGWFRLGMTNKWGSLEEGMLQNLIPTGNPEVKYHNPSKETRSVYVIVDDPGWMSSKANPFSMKVTRSWDPAQKKVDDAPIVTGIWAQRQKETKPEPATKDVEATPSKG